MKLLIHLKKKDYDRTNIFYNDYIEVVVLPINENSYKNTEGDVIHSIAFLSGGYKKYLRIEPVIIIGIEV